MACSSFQQIATQFNQNARHVVGFWSADQGVKVNITDIPVSSTRVTENKVVEFARDPGAVIDSCRCQYTWLRSVVSNFSNFDSCDQLSGHCQSKPFISCRLDYCNSLLYGMIDILIRKIQLVQNVAVGLITGAGRFDDDVITTLLYQLLHWPAVRRLVEHKVVCLVHQSLSGHAPACLADDISVASDNDRRLLRAESDRTDAIARTHSSCSDRRLGVADARVSNGLSPVLATRHWLPTLYAATETSSVWKLVVHGAL